MNRLKKYVNKTSLTVVTLWVLSLCAVSYYFIKQKEPRVATIPPVVIQAAELEKTISEIHHHLLSMLMPDGRFIYLEDSSGGKNSIDPHEYNFIRHAGAIYSLGAYEKFSPSEENRRAIERASLYLLKTAKAEVFMKQEKWLGITDLPALSENFKKNHVALGGVGLGLIALVTAEKTKPGLIGLSALQSMAKFILAFQKQDGTFNSSFLLGKNKFSDEFQSLYYPGEAILALVMLYEMDHQIKWLQAAEKGIAALGQKRRDIQNTPPDNWMLIAISKIWPHLSELSVLKKDEVLRHLKLIAFSDVKNQVSIPFSKIFGCYTHDGATTPTSTRLEGLTAVWPILKQEEPKQALELLESIKRAIHFLMLAEIKEEPFLGAIPQSSLVGMQGAQLIRIDYLQHAMSALLQFRELK